MVVKNIIKNLEKPTAPKDFPIGPPPQYYPDHTPFNFRVQMGSGAFDVVWLLVKEHVMKEAPNRHFGSLNNLLNFSLFIVSIFIASASVDNKKVECRIFDSTNLESIGATMN
jgi:hypothetical protein